MAYDFISVLSGLIAKKYESRRAFSRVAETTRDENSTQAMIAKVLNGTRPPPLHRMESWADALDLTGRERARFLDLAAIAHLPVEVQPRFLRIYEEHEQLTEKYPRILAAEGKPIPPRE